MMNHLKGYNKPELTKHRKREHDNLSYVDILGHSQRLFQICSCSYLKRDAWKGVVFQLFHYQVQYILSIYSTIEYGPSILLLHMTSFPVIGCHLG